MGSLGVQLPVERIGNSDEFVRAVGNAWIAYHKAIEALPCFNAETPTDPAERYELAIRYLHGLDEFFWELHYFLTDLDRERWGDF